MDPFGTSVERLNQRMVHMVRHNRQVAVNFEVNITSMKTIETRRDAGNVVYATCHGPLMLSRELGSWMPLG